MIVLPFKPSAPVGPCAPIPALVPVAVPDLPSRPSDAVLPNFANWSFTSLCNPIVIVSPFAVVTMSLATASPFTFNTPVERANPTLSVSLLAASFVSLPAKFNVALPATVLLTFLIASSTYSLFVASPSLVAFATFVIFMLPASIPSLPIVTVFVTPAVAPVAGACVFVIVTLSAPNVRVVPGLPVPSPLEMEVIFFNVLDKDTFNVLSVPAAFVTVMLF